MMYFISHRYGLEKVLSAFGKSIFDRNVKIDTINSQGNKLSKLRD